MATLNIGTTEISIKTAIAQVQKNIRYFESLYEKVDSSSPFYSGLKAQCQAKIQDQEIVLNWLRNAKSD